MCFFFMGVWYYQIDSWQPRTPPLKLASFVTDCNSLPTIDHSKKEHIIQLSSVVHHNKPTQNHTWDARASAACVKRLKDTVVPSSVDLSALGVSLSKHRECCDPLVETHLSSNYFDIFDPPVKTSAVKQTNNDV